MILQVFIFGIRLKTVYLSLKMDLLWWTVQSKRAQMLHGRDVWGKGLPCRASPTASQSLIAFLFFFFSLFFVFCFLFFVVVVVVF